MNIAIAGCGITGTAAGVMLARAGHQVTIFEQAEECGPVGAGIMLQPSGQAILEKLGFLDEVREDSEVLGGMTAQQVSGRKLVELQYGWLRRDHIGLGCTGAFSSKRYTTPALRQALLSIRGTKCLAIASTARR